MVKIKTGRFAGCIGTFVVDNEFISLFDEITQMWYIVPISVGYEVI